MSFSIRIPLYSQFGSVIFNEEFNTKSDQWKPISFGESKGSIDVVNGKISITKTDGNFYGSYYSTPKEIGA